MDNTICCTSLIYDLPLIVYLIKHLFKLLGINSFDGNYTRLSMDDMNEEFTKRAKTIEQAIEITQEFNKYAPSMMDRKEMISELQGVLNLRLVKQLNLKIY